ncbi:MAG TPA: VOC family protein [Sphaerochaeta sp.]|nr:VOC family protein [Sphaerochaeta sp.]
MNQQSKIAKPTLSFLNNGVAQIAYVVEDVYECAVAYSRAFGVGPWDFYTYDKTILSVMRRHKKPTEYGMRIALSYFGDTRIELIQHLHGDTVYKEFIENHGYGVQHLGFLVENIEEAMQEAESAGFAITMEGGGHGLDGDGYFAYLDTEKELGTTLELIQRPKRRRAPEFVYPKQ